MSEKRIMLRIPSAPKSIKKGFPLKLILDREAVDQLGRNLTFVYDEFNTQGFVNSAMEGISELGIKDRGVHIARAMKEFLPKDYLESLDIILKSLTPPLEKTKDNGLAGLFYMPHNSFISEYGLEYFEESMAAMYQLTTRFTCEYPIRPFIVKNESRALEILNEWMLDANPHIRRLCSEGTRSRLPWATKIDSFVKDPSPVLHILELLKDDSDLYVRRSVANHVGDIAKDHLDLAMNLCETWLGTESSPASKELKWVIRHAVRNPVKKGVAKAIELRVAAK